MTDTQNLFKEAIEQQAALKSVAIPIEAVTITGREWLEINAPESGVNKQPLRMADTAWRDLIELSGLSEAAIYHLNSKLTKSAGYKIIKMIAKNDSGAELNFVLDDTGTVIRITKGKLNEVHFQGIVNIFTDAVESNNDLQISNVTSLASGTKILIDIRNNSEFVQTGMPDEDIVLGNRITWDMFGNTWSADYAERLVCSNGMTGLSYGDDELLDTDPAEWWRIFNQAKANQDELVSRYINKLESSMENNLSVREYREIRRHLETNYGKSQLERVVKYLGRGDWEVDYHNRGIDFSQLNSKQLANCPTPVNAWDGFNALTDFGSHRYTDAGDDTLHRTQRLAARYMKRSWDADQQVLNAPTYEVTSPKN